MLTVEHTVQSYSGGTGCMCGCQGTYNEGLRARKMAITALRKRVDARMEDFGSVDSDGIAGCVFAETDTRRRVLYLTAAGVAVAKKLFPVAE